VLELQEIGYHGTGRMLRRVEDCYERVPRSVPG
jgi:hypothetical protein